MVIQRKIKVMKNTMKWRDLCLIIIVGLLINIIVYQQYFEKSTYIPKTQDNSTLCDFDFLARHVMIGQTYTTGYERAPVKCRGYHIPGRLVT